MRSKGATALEFGTLAELAFPSIQCGLRRSFRRRAMAKMREDAQTWASRFLKVSV
jgi:hypothetical protein